MRRNFIAAILAAAFLTSFVKVARADDILVAAAASLTDVLKEISSGYQSKSKHTVKFNFSPSNGLARANRQASADIFFFLLISRRWIISTKKAGSNLAREKTCSRISW